MLIHPWDAAISDTEWRDWLAGHDFGQLAVSDPGNGAPHVIPTHFAVDGDTLLVHLARPNKVWAAIQARPIVVMSVIDDYAYIPTTWRGMRNGRPGQPAHGRWPGRPRPSCGAADRNRPPGEQRGCRAWRPGGGSSSRHRRHGPRDRTRAPGRRQRRPAVAARPEAWHEEPDAAAPGCETQFAYVLPGILQARTDPEPEASKLETSGPDAADPGPADDGRAARLDELQARADEAARRFDAQRAELNASSEHTARIEREAQAEPEAGWQAEASYEMDMEL
jgi:Putative FMN-binding domain